MKALARDGKSLLPIGVTEVSGEFERGEVVGLPRPAGTRDRARPGELLGRRDAPDHPPPSGEIEAILGYVDEPELIHRDNLVLL